MFLAAWQGHPPLSAPRGCPGGTDGWGQDVRNQRGQWDPESTAGIQAGISSSGIVTEDLQEGFCSLG